MAWDVLWAVTTVFGVMILVAAAMRLAQVPFALAHAVKYRALPKDAPPQAGSIFASPPSVSVIVPAYNEGVVLENCLRSIVASDYPDVEVICVDDGSSDNTYDLMRQLAAELPGVTAMRQQNAGKGAALNRGIKASRGEVLLLVDADGVFARDTITEMVRGFDDDLIGAVCGDDRPVNLDRVQTRFLALISHVGTGLMRRALHMLGALPVVSGNSGAFRRDVLDVTGLLREDTIGEDLELTWRIYRAGYRVAFRPTALVYAESPSTFRGLWKQRVRWSRGLLQSIKLHRDMVGNPRFGFFGVYLGINYLTQVLVPVLQVVSIVLLAALAVMSGGGVLPATLWQWVLFAGLPISVALLLLALALNRSWRDVRFIWTLPLWPVYSTVMSLVMLRAIVLELRGAENRWNKLERTGVVSVGGDHRAKPGG